PKRLPKVRPAAIAVISAHPTMVGAHLCRPSLTSGSCQAREPDPAMEVATTLTLAKLFPDRGRGFVEIDAASTTGAGRVHVAVDAST
ncbi:hypothetical protein, partial [Aquabacterium commune]|uniref:hypothetical protein n=1 Tax=Aquabacterium commune TaxID=70586 RepID=UPI001AAD4AFA